MQHAQGDWCNQFKYFLPSYIKNLRFKEKRVKIYAQLKGIDSDF